MRHLALADITDDDVQRMLAENETLFVEHKGGLGGEGFQVARAMCSFANMLGGWVLIGVTEGAPNAGRTDGWTPCAPHELTDLVRETLKVNGVDPVPSFAATVWRHGAEEAPVGVVRVHESVDTPHVMRNGQVFLRSVAEDRQGQKVYRPGGVETQALLLALADRGRDGLREARQKLHDPGSAVLASRAAGFRNATWSDWVVAAGAVGIRAVPVTADRMADRAVSASARGALERSLRKLARGDEDHPVDDPQPHALGLTVTARSDDLLDSEERGSGSLAIATDTAGVVGASMRLGGQTDPPRPPVRLTLNGVRDLLLAPLLRVITDVLEDGEFYGRVLLELRPGDVQHVVTFDDSDGIKPVLAIPVRGELTLPLDPAGAEIAALAQRWCDDLARSAVFLTLRPG
jgi:hypothetical protein